MFSDISYVGFSKIELIHNKHENTMDIATVSKQYL